MTNVRARAIRDWRRLSVSSFNLDLVLTAPAPGSQTVTAKGIGTNNAINIQTDGQDVIVHNVHIAINEAEILANNSAYPVRNSEGFVDLIGHRVSFLDANGTQQNYQINYHFPDNTVGMIMCDCVYFNAS